MTENTVVDWYEVDGPYVKAGSTGTVTWSMQPNTTVGVVTQVAAPTTNNVIATDNAGQVRNTGTGNRGRCDRTARTPGSASIIGGSSRRASDHRIRRT